MGKNKQHKPNNTQQKTVLAGHVVAASRTNYNIFSWIF